MAEKPPAQRTWGGRFETKPDELMTRINASIGFDKRLWREDIAASKAHAAMLGDRNIISQADAAAILEGLERIAVEFERDGVPERADLEDIHMTVEHRLTELIGPAAGRLHTARSRNDQVATDFRLWVRNASDEALDAVRRLQRVLVERAVEHAETIIPGFTHLQVAQPVTLGHHLMAYYEMLRRDASRFADARARMNDSPLGSAALAGTGFPIDRHATAQSLGFERPTANSLDSVSDRDFVIELGASLALIAVHLSRLAEEIVLWNTREFGFIELADSVATGSSIMPQKKNPDVAELIRGKTGRLYGNLTAALTTMKGLPLTYNSDMQEDKEPLFDTVDTLEAIFRVLPPMLGSLTFQVDRMREAAGAHYSTATDLADYLVRRGLPFREAHEVVGQAVRHAIARGCELGGLSLEELRRFSPLIADDVYPALTVEASLRARAVVGGTAPEAVRRQLAHVKGWLGA
jgi:argininosuccinate lyase